jgi:hypothetical protein
MFTTGRTFPRVVMVLIVVAAFGQDDVVPKSLAAEERAIQQLEPAPSSWIGQKCVTKYATPLK